MQPQPKMTFSKTIRNPKQKGDKTFRKPDDGQEIICKAGKVKAPKLYGASPVARPLKFFRGKNKFAQKKACPLIKQERREKKFLQDLQKLGLKPGKSIQIGIANDLYRCKVVMIDEMHLYLFYQGRSYQSAQDASKHSLKSIKRMCYQAEYLMDLNKKRATNRARKRRKTRKLP